MLSSSPARSPIAITPTHIENVAMSSSPPLPSPSQLFSGMPTQLQSGSRAAPIPKDAIHGFACASSLLRQARSEGEEGHLQSAERLGLADRLASTKSRSPIRTVKDPGVPTNNKPAAKFRKPDPILVERPNCARETENATGDPKPANDPQQDASLPPKKARKKKSTKEGGEGQTKLQKTRITKPGAPKTKAMSKKDLATDQPKTKSREIFNTLLPSQEEDAKAKEEFRGLCLDKAIPLRRQWTPCKDTVQNPTSTCTIELQDTPFQEASATNPAPPRFGQLLGDFGFVKQDGELSVGILPGRQDTGEAVMKRRKIEIVQGIPTAPAAEKPKKTKSPKKKPQTITEKATAPFAVADGNSLSLLEHFVTPNGLLKAGGENQGIEIGVVSEGSMIAGKSPARKVSKKKGIVTKAKTKTQPTLISPESAMKTIENQAMIFGTSSQLAREESPTCIKDLQRTIESSAPLSQDWENSTLSAGKFRTSNSLVFAQPRNLWSSASRDLEGSLLDVETVDLSKTPKPAKVTTESATSTAAAKATILPSHPESSGLTTSANETLAPPTFHLEATPAVEHADEASLVLPRSVAEATLKKRPDNRSAVKNATNDKADPLQMPNYQGFTDAQLAKEVAAYGFKSIKKREAMITLLERCWESKISLAHQEVQANLAAQIPVTAAVENGALDQGTPGARKGRSSKGKVVSETDPERVVDAPVKKPRGRPKKDPNASTTTPKRKRNRKPAERSENTAAAEDEIYDSSPPTPSPPRRRSSSKSPRQLQLTRPSKVTFDKDAILSATDRTLLFERLTEIVKAFPPTYDPGNLSFYERILMYEPIVIEDLAAWLDTQKVSRAGVEDKVWPGMVKQWCEENSICCLWRENLRGGNRGRW